MFFNINCILDIYTFIEKNCHVYSFELCSGEKIDNLSQNAHSGHCHVVIFLSNTSDRSQDLSQS